MRVQSYLLPVTAAKPVSASGSVVQPILTSTLIRLVLSEQAPRSVTLL